MKRKVTVYYDSYQGHCSYLSQAIENGLDFEVVFDEDGEYEVNIKEPVLLLIKSTKKFIYEYDSRFGRGIEIEVLDVGSYDDLDDFVERAEELRKDESVECAVLSKQVEIFWRFS